MQSAKVRQPSKRLGPAERIEHQIQIAAYTARVREGIARATHVRVGDHPPERRVVHCRFGDQPACAPHGHSCSCEPYRDKVTGLMCVDDADGYQRVAPSDAPRWDACVGRPQTHPTRAQGGYGASFDD